MARLITTCTTHWYWGTRCAHIVSRSISSFWWERTLEFQPFVELLKHYWELRFSGSKTWSRYGSKWRREVSRTKSIVSFVRWPSMRRRGDDVNGLVAVGAESGGASRSAPQCPSHYYSHFSSSMASSTFEEQPEGWFCGGGGQLVSAAVAARWADFVGLRPVGYTWNFLRDMPSPLMHRDRI